MLRQEINLYRQYYVKNDSGEKSLLTWRRYWLSNIAFAVLMTIITIVSFFENSYLKFSLFRSQKQLTELQQQFVKLKSTFPQLFFNQNINEAVENLKKEMAAQKAIVQILSQHAPFSDSLQAFSRTIVAKVWLTNILIEKSGNQIALKGDSFGMDNLNSFIKNLESDKVFSTYTVSMHQMHNSDVNNPDMRLQFEILMVRKNHA